MREPKPLSAAHKAKIAAGMRDYHRKCHNGGAHVLLGTQTLSPTKVQIERQLICVWMR